MIKVVQIQTRYHRSISNSSDLTRQIIQALPEDRFQITNVFLSGKPCAKDMDSAMEYTIYLNLPEAALKGLRLRAHWKLFHFLKKEAFDIAILHRFKPVSLMLHLSRLLSIKRYIGIVHGVGDYDKASRQRQVKSQINECWQFIAVSEPIRGYLERLNCGLSLKNVTVIPNAIDVDQVVENQLNRASARAALDIALDVFIVGCIGRLVPVKGHEILIRAVAQLIKDYSNLHVVIIGEGRLENELKALADQLCPQKRVHFTGWKDQASRYIKAFDLFVMPSYSEGLPLALLEAISGRVPVIGSDIPMLKPIIEGVGGGVFKRGDPDSLTLQLKKHIDLGTTELNNLGQQGFLHLNKQYSIAAFHDQYLQLVSQAFLESTS